MGNIKFGIVALVAALAGSLPLHSNGDCNSLNLNTAPLTAAPAAERHSHAAWQGQSDRAGCPLLTLFSIADIYRLPLTRADCH